MSTKPRLLDILAATGDHTERLPSGALAVFPSDKSRREYFCLEDWCVSTVSGPVLWMTPKTGCQHIEMKIQPDGRTYACASCGHTFK